MNDTINGLPNLDQIKMVNPIVEMLKQVIKAAEAGELTTVAVVAVNHQGGVGWQKFGGQRAELFVATSLFQDELKVEMRAPAAPRPTIIRPGFPG